MLRFALLALLAASAASAQTYTGQLAPGDDQLGAGEYVDEYAVQARRGQTIRAVVTSAEFDTYVIVKSGSGEQQDNDDCTEGDLTRSCAEFVADRDGRVRILVTSYAPEETGDYRVEVSVGASSAPTSVVTGDLSPGDDTIANGEYADRQTVTLEAGDAFSATLTSSAFDTYLGVISPSGAVEENDDCTEGEVTRSCVNLVADASGEWTILITSYAPSETGAYRLEYTTGAESDADEDRPMGGVRTERGRLEGGDLTLQSGEFQDRYSVAGTGGPVVIDLRSTDFDPYLIVETPDGDQFDNDDHEGALDRSLLVLQTREGESYDVVVTSYAPGETGAYTLDLRGDDAASAGGVRTEAGTLGGGDDTLESGEFFDTYTFDGVPGQRLRVDLTSDDFDTYLAVQTPTGDLTHDDDGGGRVGHSVVELDLTEPGSYTVIATSYAGGETGAYQLAIDQTARFGQVTEAASVAPAGGPQRARAYSAPSASRGGLDLDETLAGALDARDQRRGTGAYQEVHTFDGEEGEPVRIEMTSDEFDTYLIVESPSGEQLANDDFDGSTARSQVEFMMPETGRYRVFATSYQPGAMGSYRLRMSQTDALAPEPIAYDRIVGLFVGISDYDRMGDLRWTAEDAEQARDAMLQAGMAPDDGILLTDREATDANVRAAIRRLAARSDDRTLFVLFYSGHGGQYARTEFQRADPDGLDESIELFDREILDDDLDALLATIPSSRQLVVLDACYSGGFSKDVISRPGRMGLFSSEEDIVSSVAVKFEAGGYLSKFFSEAVAERRADADNNGAVTALELSLYLDDRFATEVRSEGGGMIARHDFRAEHQKLVVDRGSLGLYESLFLFRP